MNYAVIVPLKHAQTSRKLLEDANIWDETRRLKNISEEQVAIPVRYKDFEVSILSGVAEQDLEIIEMILPKSKKSAIKTPGTVLLEAVRDLLKDVDEPWSKEIENDLPTSWEKHGDLILLSDSCFNLLLWNHFDDKLWGVVADSLGCKRLAKKSVICSNGFRTPQVKLLLGDHGWVQQVDNKLRFTYDVTKCMFSIGNITEKLRIAKFNCTNETVVDLYAGIGYFTLPYLVHAGAKHVHSCEWNSDAVDALRKNLKLNSVQDRCTVYFGDNKKVCPVGVADRVNLGLIPSSEDGWFTACAALRPNTGGFLHIHGNVTSFATDKQSHHTSIHVKDTNISHVCDCQNVESSDASLNNCDSTVCIKVHGSGEKTCETSHKSSWYVWSETVASKIRQLLLDYHHSEWITTINHIEHIKSYAPHVHHLVLDLECRPRIM